MGQHHASGFAREEELHEHEYWHCVLGKGVCKREGSQSC